MHKDEMPQHQREGSIVVRKLRMASHDEIIWLNIWLFDYFNGVGLFR